VKLLRCASPSAFLWLLLCFIVLFLLILSARMYVFAWAMLSDSNKMMMMRRRKIKGWEYARHLAGSVRDVRACCAARRPRRTGPSWQNFEEGPVRCAVWEITAAESVEHASAWNEACYTGDVWPTNYMTTHVVHPSAKHSCNSAANNLHSTDQCTTLFIHRISAYIT